MSTVLRSCPGQRRLLAPSTSSRARPEASSVTLRGRFAYSPGPRRRSTQSLRTINSLETSGLDGGSSGRLMVFAMQHLLEETMQCVE